MIVDIDQVLADYTKNMVYNKTNPIQSKEEVLYRISINDGFVESLKKDKINTVPVCIGEFTKAEQKIYKKKYFLIEGFCRYTALSDIPDSKLYCKLIKGVSFDDRLAWFKIQSLNEQRTKKEALAVARTIYDISQDEKFQNMTRKEIAHAIGIAPATLSNYIQVMENTSALRLIEQGLISFNVALILIRQRVKTGHTVNYLYDCLQQCVEGDLTVAAVNKYFMNFKVAEFDINTSVVDSPEAAAFYIEKSAFETNPAQLFVQNFRKNYGEFDPSVYIALENYLESINYGNN